MSHRGQMIAVTSGDGARIGCYHVDAVGARKGGLVLVMEIFGVTDHIKDRCDAFAAAGYEVLSPQLYDRTERDFQTGHDQGDIQRALAMRARNTYNNTVRDVQACIDVLAPRGRVACTGYCYGGSVTWLAACRCTGLAAASGYYGGAIKDYLGETPRCPTILHFGAHDSGIPLTDVERIRAAHPDVAVYVYPDAGHGFQSDRPTHYHAESARLAQDRTLALFDAAMAAPTP